MISKKMGRNERLPLTEFLLPKIVEALKHPLRYRILELLREEPNRELSYSEIREALNVVNTATLTHHLNVLLNAHLIKSRIDVDALKERKGRQYYSYYSLTRFGQAFLEGLTDLVHNTLAKLGEISEPEKTFEDPIQIVAKP